NATIISKAGLKRLGLTENITQTLPTDVFPPSVGQGAIAVISRSDFDAIDLLYKINHKNTMAAVTAERALLKSLGGGCQVPIGVVSNINKTKININAVVLSPDGKWKVTTAIKGDIEEAKEIGNKAALKLLQGGAEEILKDVYGQVPSTE
ncbi:MAG: hydroxymethylbilane synthase, partial [Candidatus Hydrothermarchaeales archaeon]